MKKKIVLALCLLASLASYGQTTKTVEGKKVTISNLVAGHLADYLSDEERFTGTHTETFDDGEDTWEETVPNDPLVETLVVSGEINGDDIRILADMSRWNWWDLEHDTRVKRGRLSHLDISECQIVAGGGYYFDETFTDFPGYGSNITIEARPTEMFIPIGTYQLSTTDNEIGELMFFGCDMLEELVLPKTITKIGAHAFESLLSMTEIKIPASVSSIGESAFLYSINLNVATYDEELHRWDVKPLKVTFLNEEEPMALGDDALKLGEAFGQEVIVDLTTPVGLLDDYALNSVLKDNFEAGSVKATATPPNKYWTFSSGVDVIIPDNVKVYTCQIVNGETDIREITDDLIVDEKRVIKRNNGVLVACPDNAESNAYELVAKYNADLVGTTPATTNANDYPNNSLVPVIKKAHYNSGEYYMLYHGKWVVLAGDDAKVPAGKALLKK